MIRVVSEIQNELTQPLIARAGNGDERAFEELLARYAPRIELFILRHAGHASGPDEGAEDLFARIVYTVWTQLPKFEDRGDGSFYRWVIAIARHVISNRLRYLRRKRRHGTVPLESSTTDGGGRSLADPKTSVSRIAARSDDVQSLRRALDRLNVDDRALIEAHVVGGQTIREIASRRGLSTGAVFKRVHAILIRLDADLGAARDR